MPRIKLPPPTSTVAVTINNIFINCHYPSNNSKPLTYNLSFTVFYYPSTTATGTASGKTALTPINFPSSATNPLSNVTFNAQFPNDGTPFTIDCVIAATQCSTCAVQGFPGDLCIQFQTTNGIAAARPVIEFTSNLATTRNPPPTVTYNVTPAFFVDNVAGTCGCVVPFQ